jgi:hypothetical protein
VGAFEQVVALVVLFNVCFALFGGGEGVGAVFEWAGVGFGVNVNDL